MVTDQGDGKLLAALLGESEEETAPFMVVYSSELIEDVEGADIPEGWSEISVQPVRGRKYTQAQLFRAFIAKLKGEHLRDDVPTEWVATPITTVKTFEFAEATTIDTISDNFAPLNGTVLGVVEGEASLPTIDTDTFYSSLIVDPTALTDAEMDAYLASLDFNSRSVKRQQPVLKKLLQKEPTRDDGEASIMLTSARGDLWRINAYAGEQGGDPLRLEAENLSAIIGDGDNLVIKGVYYSTAEFTVEGETVPKGWSEITYDAQSEEITIVPLTQKTTYTVDYEGLSVIHFDTVSNQFEPLNGTVFGAQEYSGETLSITGNITNGTLTGATTTVAGAQVSCTIVPESGHVIPEESDIVVTNGVIADYGTDGSFQLMASGNVTITATCPAETPTPSLTPFSVGQSITGIDFGNVQNGETSADMDAFLAGLTYTEGSAVLLAKNDGGEEREFLVAFSQGGLYALSLGETVLYATQAVPDFAVAGFNNLTDGKWTDVDVIEIASVNPAEGWNGILVGAVVGQAPVTSYPITANITNGAPSYNTATTIDENGTAIFSISPDSGYTYPNDVTVVGASYVYDNTKGDVTLSNPTGNVTIDATCPSSGESK